MAYFLIDVFQGEGGGRAQSEEFLDDPFREKSWPSPATGQARKKAIACQSAKGRERGEFG